MVQSPFFSRGEVQTHHDHSITQPSSTIPLGIGTGDMGWGGSEDDPQDVGSKVEFPISILNNRAIGEFIKDIDKSSPVFAVGVSVITTIGLLIAVAVLATYEVLEMGVVTIAAGFVIFLVPPLTGGSIAGWYTTEGSNLAPVIIGISYPLASAAIFPYFDLLDQSTDPALLLIAIPIQVVVGYIAFQELQKYKQPYYET